MMMKSFIAIVSLFALSAVSVVRGQEKDNLWVGTNSWLLHAYPPADRAEILDNIKAAGMSVVRIFIAQSFAGEKGPSMAAINDLETAQVGVYDDTILKRIDDLMFEAFSRGLKLNIALHDRYSLGCFKTDAYTKKYRLPIVSQCPKGNDIRSFYTNRLAGLDMDRRFRHIMAHKNPRFGNRPWSAIPEAIFGFDIENEAQAYGDGVGNYNFPIANRNWVCQRATSLRRVLPKNILIVTGGGASFDDSLLPEHFNCPAIDVVSVHSYNNDFSSRLGAGVTTAVAKNKRIIVQEFGAQSNKVASVGGQMDSINAINVPWMVWQVAKPNNPNDFEIYATDTAMWSTLKSKALAARQHAAAQNWPEVN